MIACQAFAFEVLIIYGPYMILSFLQMRDSDMPGLSSDSSRPEELELDSGHYGLGL